MKSKRLIIMLIVLVLSIAFTGCDAINGAFDSVFLSTPEVKAADLADYDTTEGEVGSDADIEEGLELAFSALGNSASSRTILGDEHQAILEVMRISAPDIARIIAPESPASRQATASASASITDEQITEGTMTVTIDEVSFSGEVNLDDLDAPTEATAEFDAKVELGFSDIDAEYYDDVNFIYVPYTVENFRINANGGGNGTATFGVGGYENLQQIDYYTGVAVSIGFSISAPDCSGKYLMNFKYVNSATINANDPDPNFTGEQSLEIIVSVYNNSGTLIRERTFTETDIFMSS